MSMLRSMSRVTKATHFIPASHPLTVSPLAGECNNKSRGQQPRTPGVVEGRGGVSISTTPTRRPCAPLSSAGQKSPRTQRREKTAAAVAKRYKLRRKELWAGALKDNNRNSPEQRNQQLWVDGPGNFKPIIYLIYLISMPLIYN